MPPRASASKTPASDGAERRRPAKKRAPAYEEKWAEYSRALIITAHPDDAEFIAGGTIAKMCDLGWDVRICVATSGDKGTRDVNMRPQELAAIREAEQRAAAAVLGIKECIFWGYPDGFLMETPELRGQVVELIRRLKPDVVVTWDGYRPGFNHHDHRTIGRVVRDALYPAAHDPHYFPEHRYKGVAAHRTAELLLAATNEPDLHVDIGPWLERKVDAVLCHASQIDGRSREEMLQGWRAAAKRDRERRKRTGYEFSESFRRIMFRRPAPAEATAAAGTTPQASQPVSA
ncbi:MAG TPA: PIG-L deacetylase family protein [Dehalococcoidia bacterium]|nr:PIG-L deacetylase family protein [Dehalococcoidia bacterium]